MTNVLLFVVNNETKRYACDKDVVCIVEVKRMKLLSVKLIKQSSWKTAEEEIEVILQFGTRATESIWENKKNNRKKSLYESTGKDIPVDALAALSLTVDKNEIEEETQKVNSYKQIIVMLTNECENTW